MAQYPATIDLSSMDGANGFVVQGGAGSGQFGRAVSSAGDLNGDGLGDLVFGSPAAGFGGTYSGAAYVLFGQHNGFAANVDFSALGADDGLRLDGAGANDFLGVAVACAGDVNGDGVSDLIVGASLASGTAHYAGAAYVVFGSTSGFTSPLQVSDLDGADGFSIFSSVAGDGLGRSVESAGDVNGDGFDDLIVGAPNADPNGSYCGASYVVFGKAGGFAAGVDVATLDGANGFQIAGLNPYDRAGLDVSSAGDVNADGIDDLLVGSANASPTGKAYVVFGRTSGFDAALDLTSLDGSNGFSMDQSGGALGLPVAQAGDINGDGIDDIVVAAQLAGYAGINSGAAYVVFGKSTGFAADVALDSLNGHNGFRIDGAGANNYSFSEVAAAGDVNGDGFGDLILGARLALNTSGAHTGEAYVVFGHAGGFDPNLNVAALDGTNGFRLDGAAAYSDTGSTVSSAGDVNGDGLDDVMVGSSTGGAAYIVYGRLPDAAVDRTGTVLSQALVGGDFDDSLAGVGGDDVLWGHGGGDALRGGQGDDTLLGGDGNDRLVGGDGADSMVGGGGNDIFYAENPADVIVELDDEGHDTLNTNHSLTLQAGQSIELLKVWGSSAGLALTGNEFGNRLVGGVGDDTLQGAGGRDGLVGGDGADHFVFAEVGDSPVLERDRIVDFHQGEDLIDLRLIDADSTQAGDQAFTLADGVHFHAVAGEMIVRHNGGVTMLLADIDGDRSADFALVVAGNLTLTAADFML